MYRSVKKRIAKPYILTGKRSRNLSKNLKLTLKSEWIAQKTIFRINELEVPLLGNDNTIKHEHQLLNKNTLDVGVIDSFE